MKTVLRRRLVVRPKARLDNFTITDRVARDSPDAAEALEQGFASRLEELCVSGGALLIRPEFGDAIRVAQFKFWLIFFRISDMDMIILRVLHGAMHPKRMRSATGKM
jgi:plasmid stabilization system protein ParE